MSNVFLAVVPLPEDDNGEDFFAFAILGHPELNGALSDIKLLLPENWDDDYVPHLWDINAVCDDIESYPEFNASPEARKQLADLGVTHLALLEGPVVPDNSSPIKWGADLVKGVSILLFYCGVTGKYMMLCCQTCAYVYAKWLETKQPEWFDVESSGFQDPRKALN